MQTGYYNNTAGMVAQFNRLDVISNNLANMNTNAFKRDDVVIGDFMRLYKEARDELPLKDQTKEAAQFTNSAMVRVPQVVEEYTDRSIGGMMQTGNGLDFALQRADLFFAVQTPAGIRYTRDGAFVLDDSGKLVTKEGYPVLPREHFEDGTSTTSYPKDLTVTTDKDGNLYANNTQFGNVAVVQFANPKYLTKEGGNLYHSEREEERSAMSTSGAVISGFIEKSNINPVSEMVGLIETNRLVEFYQRVMRTHMDDLNSEAISKLANIKA